MGWFDGLIEANEKYFEEHGEPLFSSHMLDLSEDPLEENVGTCVDYLKRMSKCNVLLEMELGVTGGEEDGVDNSDVDSSKLYTQPEEVYEVYKALSAVEGGRFTIAAAFGNVHGVYSRGNVQLTPQILHNCQSYIKEKEGLDTDKPCSAARSSWPSAWWRPPRTSTASTCFKRADPTHPTQSSIHHPPPSLFSVTCCRGARREAML